MAYFLDHCPINLTVRVVWKTWRALQLNVYRLCKCVSPQKRWLQFCIFWRGGPDKMLQFVFILRYFFSCIAEQDLRKIVGGQDPRELRPYTGSVLLYCLLRCSPFIRPKLGKLCEASCVVSIFRVHCHCTLFLWLSFEKKLWISPICFMRDTVLWKRYCVLFLCNNFFYYANCLHNCACYFEYMYQTFGRDSFSSSVVVGLFVLLPWCEWRAAQRSMTAVWHSCFTLNCTG